MEGARRKKHAENLRTKQGEKETDVDGEEVRESRYRIFQVGDGVDGCSCGVVCWRVLTSLCSRCQASM